MHIINEFELEKIYSKYYWYTKYKKIYFEVYGHDAGIEQEGFKLLEELENDLEEGVDWTIIQEIEESKIQIITKNNG